MTEVGGILRASMAAHVAAKRKNQPRDLDRTREAYELRKQAHGLDPQHEDGAWSQEQGKTSSAMDTHGAMMAFYEGLLGG